jgi:hypothetical protein
MSSQLIGLTPSLTTLQKALEQETESARKRRQRKLFGDDVPEESYNMSRWISKNWIECHQEHVMRGMRY